MDHPNALSLWALIVLAGFGCDGEIGDGHVQRAEVVVVANGHTGQGFHDVERAINGVRGGGLGQGSLDVFSLPLTVPRALVLGFPEPVFDRPGMDVAVFENPFDGFVDPVVVELSADCETFVALPHMFLGDAYTADPEAWPGFAGRNPVRLHEEAFPVDPLGPDAGGDQFDLADLTGKAEFDAVLANGVACIGLSSASSWVDPNTGAPFPMDPVSNGADIDGVYGAATKAEIR